MGKWGLDVYTNMIYPNPLSMYDFIMLMYLFLKWDVLDRVNSIVV